MSFRVVRQSKFRHVFGTAAKKEDVRVELSSFFCVLACEILTLILIAHFYFILNQINKNKTGLRRRARDAQRVGLELLLGQPEVPRCRRGGPGRRLLHRSFWGCVKLYKNSNQK